MNEQGVPIPDPRKLSQEELIALLQKATSDLQELRRATERRLHEADVKARTDLDRLRAATSGHAKDLEAQNSALLKSLARLQMEVDALRSEVAVLRAVPPGPPAAGTSVPGGIHAGLPIAK